MIAVVTMFGERYNDVAAVTLPNLYEYCKRHSYIPHVIHLDGDENNYHYKKHEYFQDLMKDKSIEAIWYRDIDCIVTNFKIKVTSFLNNDGVFYITRDVHELNGGSFILKNNDLGIKFNEEILSSREEYPNEQNAYNAFINSLYFLYGRMVVLKHPSINSYDYSLYKEYPNVRSMEEGNWHLGNFLLHVPALPIEQRIEILKNATIIR